eukprot:366471-Chlamydomonas_euryale.AAC.8
MEGMRRREAAEVEVGGNTARPPRCALLAPRLRCRGFCRGSVQSKHRQGGAGCGDGVHVALARATTSAAHASQSGPIHADILAMISLDMGTARDCADRTLHRSQSSMHESIQTRRWMRDSLAPALARMPGPVMPPRLTTTTNSTCSQSLLRVWQEDDLRIATRRTPHRLSTVFLFLTPYLPWDATPAATFSPSLCPCTSPHVRALRAHLFLLLCVLSRSHPGPRQKQLRQAPHAWCEAGPTHHPTAQNT